MKHDMKEQKQRQHLRFHMMNEADRNWTQDFSDETSFDSDFENAGYFLIITDKS
jgi:hypothetical protein